MSDAERARNYRERHKADQETVTHHEDVSGFRGPASRGSDVTNHVSVRDEFAGRDGCPAVGDRRDEGEVVTGELRKAERLTMTIAGRTHGAITCEGCGLPVPLKFSYDRRHMMCGPMPAEDAARAAA